MLTRASKEQRCAAVLAKINRDDIDYSKFAEQFVNATSPIDVICKKCGFQFQLKAATLYRNKGCCPCQSKSMASFPLQTRLAYFKRILLQDEEREFPNLEAEFITGTDDRITIKCKKCGHIYSNIVNEILRGNARCFCVTGKFSHESLEVRRQYFAEKLKAHPDFNTLDFADAVRLYQTNKIDVPVRCKIHSSIFMVKPSNLINGNRCPKCANESRIEKLKQFAGANSPIIISFAEALDRAKEAHNDKYDYSQISESSWQGASQKYKIICPVHGEFEQSFARHLSGQGCLKCGQDRSSTALLLGFDEWIKRAKEVHGDAFDYSFAKETERFGACSKIEVVCNICGCHFFPTAKNHVLNKSGCPKCEKKNRLKRMAEMAGANKKNHAYYIDKAIKLNGNNYDYSMVESVPYEGIDSKVPIICKVSGHGIFWQSWTAHIKLKEGCPKCNRSKMERTLARKLADRGIVFEEEKTFPGLVGVNGYPLRFDFYLPKQNVCIECDGIQHFSYFPAFHKSEADFKRQQEHDRRKDEFCLSHGIRLIRVTSEAFLD